MVEKKNNYRVLDSGVHHFPVVSCQCCGKTIGSHIILDYRLLQHGLLDVQYTCFCDVCFNDYCMMKEYKNDE
jgi:hypothetical protein